MRYRKDERTENLTLRDIHVGDWVQVWSEATERYSPPLKIIQICDDGTIYLVTSDEERPTPWEEDIKNVDALPINEDILGGFGFEQKIQSGIFEYEGYPFYYYTPRGIFYTDKFAEHIEYFHHIQGFLTKWLPDVQIKFEWKGIGDE